jgi:adenylate kinase family enzyme
MILGSSGSGKSTLAKQLGEITGLPVIHLDRLFWNPGWVQTPKEEMYEKVAEAASAESWIIDGNYSGAMDLRLERTDTVVYIDFNRFICIFRAIKRRIQNHGKTRDDMGEGCPEKIDWEFLKWIWNFPKRTKKILHEKINHCGKNVYHLKSRKAVKQFIHKTKGEKPCP